MSSPIWQAVVVLSATAIILTGNWLLNLLSPQFSDALFPWSIASAFTLFFALLNSLLSLRADSFAKYWQASMYSYVVLAFGTGLLAWAFSGIAVGKAGSYKWIYIVVSIGFMVFLSMVNFMKIIVKFAEKEEWNQPRSKR
ncbi:MAG: hypothetical protein JNJ57_06920 [Saprospiraceae bacterium]|nr:hypothetical protein [Saprospiraceae bacterium]